MEDTTFGLFDFDGTIAKGDSIIPFILYAYKKGFAPLSALPGTLWGLVGYGLRIYSDTVAKERAMAFMAGKTVTETEAFCQGFYNAKLKGRVFPKARQEIAALREKGAKILVVTASPAFYLNPIKGDLGVDDIIGTRMDVDEKGVYTGRFCGNNCRGLEKPLRIAEYLAAKGLTLDKETSAAYGDSGHDAPMLSLVANPVAVNPKKKLKELCPEARQVAW